MTARHATTRHTRRANPHGNPASALIAAYIATHPTSAPATWSRAMTQNQLRTEPIPAQQSVPMTNPVLSILRPSVASL